MIDIVLDSATDNLNSEKKIGKDKKQGVGISPYVDNLGNTSYKRILNIALKNFVLISFIIITILTLKIYNEAGKNVAFTNVLENLINFYQYFLTIIYNSFISKMDIFLQYLDLKQYLEFTIKKIEVVNKTPVIINILIVVMWFIFTFGNFLLYFYQAQIQKKLHTLGYHKGYVPLWALYYYFKRKTNGYFYYKKLEGELHRGVSAITVKNLVYLFLNNKDLNVSQRVELDEKPMDFFTYQFFKISINIEQKRENAKNDIKTDKKANTELKNLEDLNFDELLE